MRYLVIGLGIYGANLARDLVAQGHEVIGADSSRVTVDAIKDYITTAYIIDTTEEAALGVLPLRNIDLVIVAIGENSGASVKTVALLKKAGVKKIYARAIDPLHESILESFKVDRILRPEQRAALDLTHEMALGTDVEALRLTDDSYILKFKTPKFLAGLDYADLALDKQFGLRLVAVTRQADKVNVLGIQHPEASMFDFTAPGTKVEETDTLVVCGSLRSFQAFYRRFES